jgi:ribonuclease HI/ADP-ribose pyrophosphatase YjhB (NUDIX family)
MKQKVVTRVIVKDKRGRTLLLRRYGGRPSIAGQFELPGGRIWGSEQPIDAVKRTLKYHTGLVPQAIQLVDVLSFVDPDNRDLQYIFVLYLASLPANSEKVILSDEYDKYLWKKMSEIQRNVVTNSTNILLDMKFGGDSRGRIDNSKSYIVYTDGGSRGNPGPSAAGWVLMDMSENIVDEGSQFLGSMDSATAEYAAIVLAMKHAVQIGARRLEVRSDSLMAVNQINGLYMVDKPAIKPLYAKVVKLKKHFEIVKFTHVKREFNRMADGVVNRTLDEITQ